jgi:MoCo/4Fe-4S cofactor protein with predicted Tat translocation signal
MNPQDTAGGKMDIAALRSKLDGAAGPKYWRSLDELAETPEFLKFVDDEFPSRAEDLRNPATRRDVLRVMGAAFGLAGLTACTRQPPEKILPYVRQPEEIVLGQPLYYATAMPFRGAAVGLLVQSYEGRPTKVEGNPQHPASLGRTNLFHQASTLGLYDPDRSQAVYYHGRISTWGEFLGRMAELRETLGSGEGFHVLSEPLHSPTVLWQRSELQKRYPGMQWYEYDPVGYAAQEGIRAALGQAANPIYDFAKADVVLSLDSDFLFTTPASIVYARAFSARRHAEADRARMNRLYVIEPTPSITGDTADHRLPVKASEVEAVARAVAARIGAGAGQAPNLRPELSRFADAVAKDLQAHRGSSIVIAGEYQPASVHALAHALNQSLGNVGATVRYTQLFEPEIPAATRSLPALVSAMREGRVKTLLIMGANPVYTAAADLEFAKHLNAVPLRIHLGLYRDETAALCQWHVPEAHYLESWSDAVAYDGTACVVQPLIAPVYGGRTAHEFLGTLTETPDRSSYQLVKSYWQSQYRAADFEQTWERWLHDGVIPNTAFGERQASSSAPPPAVAVQAAGAQTGRTGLEIVFRADPCVWDGRFANNAWLQETPKPHTKLTWDNTVYISPRTAERLGLESRNVIELRYRGRSIRGPVWVVPGQADDSVTVFFGYGRTRAGRVANRTGYNAYALRTLDHPYFDAGVEVVKTGDNYQLACTQTHHTMAGRDLIHSASNASFLANPGLFKTEETQEHEVSELSLYPGWKSTGYRWGMAIDLNACIGCNACIVACVAENNVPVVGKEQVARGREMHWLRVDRYHSGSLENPQIHFQPLPCMQCEQAPCEPVCPVAATVHSGEGLNQMVYNRCVGTRYCSNNCPYKVRRFNFLLYQDWNTPSLAPVRNPNVTVRSRGVMEKCTYCIQRIEAAKIETQKQDRGIRDGEIQTACQQSCPTDAIIFGDLNDRSSRVHKLRNGPLHYSLLAELGTKPRTTYMAKLRNANPDLETAP